MAGVFHRVLWNFLEYYIWVTDWAIWALILKQKFFGWMLVWTGRLIGAGGLLKKNEKRNNKKCRANLFFTKITKFLIKFYSKIDFKDFSFPFVQIKTGRLIESLMLNWSYTVIVFFVVFEHVQLTHIRSMILWYRNQTIDFHCKPINWFLYECNIGLL